MTEEEKQEQRLKDAKEEKEKQAKAAAEEQRLQQSQNNQYLKQSLSISEIEDHPEKYVEPPAPVVEKP